MNARVAMLFALSSATVTGALAAQIVGQRFVRLDDDVIVRYDDGSSTRLSRSTDGGRTWSSSSQAMASLLAHDLVGDGSIVAVVGVFSSSLGGPGLLLSNDAGQTWAFRQLATWPTPNHSIMAEARAHVDGATVTVFWTAPVDSAVLMLRSTDGGQTFPGGPVVIGQSAAASTGVRTLHLNIVAQGPVAHVFWVENHQVQGQAGRLQSTFDGGLSWLPTPRALGAPQVLGGQPKLSGSLDVLLVRDLGSVLMRSLDGGATWLAATGLTLTSYSDIDVERHVGAAVGMSNPFFASWIIQRSVDGGATWSPPTFQASSANGYTADAEVIGSDVFVGFHHPSFPQSSVVVHSRDRGATWRTFEGGVGRIAVDERRVLHVPHVAPPRVACGWTPLGGGTVGAGAVEPRLVATSLPLLDRLLSLEVSDARGATVGVVGASLPTTAPVPFAGGQVWLDAAFVGFGFATSGAAGGVGDGTAQVTLAIPGVSSLVGAELHAQAVVLDAQATANLALTQGIRLHLR